MIEKPSILITSIGRTGTEFFAHFFAEVIPAADSLHEPDIFKFLGVDDKVGHYRTQIRRAGVWRMLLLKAMGQWTLVRLSDQRFMGRLTAERAKSRLLSQRRGFIARLPGSVYVESNLGYYGLLDVTPEAFRAHRAIYIVRDGRDWVRSTLNWGEVYGKRGLRRLLAHNWPTARDISGDPFGRIWTDMPVFQKLCWAWARLNEYALQIMDHNPSARIFRFEDIFLGPDRYARLGELVDFGLSVPGLGALPARKLEGWLERKIHQSDGAFPAWDRWTPLQQHQFREICGPLMERLGYHVP